MSRHDGHDGQGGRCSHAGAGWWAAGAGARRWSRRCSAGCPDRPIVNSFTWALGPECHSVLRFAH